MTGGDSYNDGVRLAFYLGLTALGALVFLRTLLQWKVRRTIDGLEGEPADDAGPSSRG
jgi:hypothetical protein